MPSACSPGPCRPDNKRFLALAAPGAGVRLACCPDQPVNVDRVLPPIDPPVFRRAFGRPTRIAFILLKTRRRAGCERGECAWHHLAQGSHVSRIKAGSGFIRRDMEKSLLQYGAAIDAIVDPEQCASRDR